MNANRHAPEDDVVMLFGDRIGLRQSASVTLLDELSGGLDVEIAIVYDATLGRYVADQVTVKRTDDGSEVTSRALREVTVQEHIVATAMEDLIDVVLDYQAGNEVIVSGQEALDRIEAMGDRDRGEVVWDAALVYTLAYVANWPPVATVAARLGVSLSTAKRLVAEARNAYPLRGRDG